MSFHMMRMRKLVKSHAMVAVRVKSCQCGKERWTHPLPRGGTDLLTRRSSLHKILAQKTRFCILVAQNLSGNIGTSTAQTAAFPFRLRSIRIDGPFCSSRQEWCRAKQDSSLSQDNVEGK